MFLNATWDEATVSRELSWAASLGFSVVRVFLHDLLFAADGNRFLDRVDRFLAIAHRANVSAMPVLFDGCWDPRPRLGAQPEPRPHVHNSRWVQSPGAEALSHLDAHAGRLRDYVTSVIGRFAHDPRVVLWDVFNEPDNGNVGNYGARGERVPAAADAKGTELPPFDKAVAARALAERAMAWAREARPSQPLTMPVYRDPTGDAAADEVRASTYNWTLTVVDVVSFHDYAPLDGVARTVRELQSSGRPLVCSEYMARDVGSTFDPILGFLAEQRVWALNWGLVSGRSQTIYPWDSWNKEYRVRPALWHHDVLHADGAPFSAREAGYVRQQHHG